VTWNLKSKFELRTRTIEMVAIRRLSILAMHVDLARSMASTGFAASRLVARRNFSAGPQAMMSSAYVPELGPHLPRATLASARPRLTREGVRASRPRARRYDFTVRDLDNNKEVALSQYRGKVSLIVNVASK
jgi:hypothetical protein